MAEWYIYAIGIFAAGIGLLLVYIILNKMKIVGSIPILSAKADPRKMTLHEYGYLSEHRWGTLTKGEQKIVLASVRHEHTSLVASRASDAELERGITGFKKLKGRTGTGDRQLNKDIEKKIDIFEKELNTRN